jgi:transposase-like protein
MDACAGGISTRKLDALVEALGGASGISKSEVSRICQGTDMQVRAFLGRPLDHARFPNVYLDASYLHGRLGRHRAEVVGFYWTNTGSVIVNSEQDGLVVASV